MINHKSEFLINLWYIEAEVENQLERKIKILHFDRSGEYASSKMNEFCEMHGIIHEVTPPYTPQSNKVTERKNRTLFDMKNVMLISSGFPKNL